MNVCKNRHKQSHCYTEAVAFSRYTDRANPQRQMTIPGGGWLLTLVLLNWRANGQPTHSRSGVPTRCSLLNGQRFIPSAQQWQAARVWHC